MKNPRKTYHVKRITLSAFVLFLFSFSSAQNVLTPEQAVEIGLKNNLSIQVAKNEAQVAANNVTMGNAGMLPQINLTATDNISITKTNQKFATGQEQNRDNAKSQAITAGVALNWTLFDGLGMFVSYERLQQLSDMGELNARATIESEIEKILGAYYEALKQKQVLNAIQKNMALGEERIKIAERKFNIGSSSKLEYLQSKVDYNADKSALLKQGLILNNIKISLNELLGRDAATEFELPDSLSQSAPINDIAAFKTNENINMLMAEKNIRLAELSLKSLNASRLPKISLISNYNFTQSESQAGFLLSNRQLGPTIGLSATMPIFNGFSYNTGYKNSQLQLMSSRVRQTQMKIQTDAAITKSFNNYRNQLDILKLEEENIKVARENVVVVMERFKLGNASALEVKEAQQSLLEAETRLANARFEIKTAEIALKRVAGQLLK